jgi:hypothetical protein
MAPWVPERTPKGPVVRLGLASAVLLPLLACRAATTSAPPAVEASGDQPPNDDPGDGLLFVVSDPFWGTCAEVTVVVSIRPYASRIGRPLSLASSSPTAPDRVFIPVPSTDSSPDLRRTGLERGRSYSAQVMLSLADESLESGPPLVLPVEGPIRYDGGLQTVAVDGRWEAIGAWLHVVPGDPPSTRPKLITEIPSRWMDPCGAE